MRHLFSALAATALTALSAPAARAEPPSVATDIAPVHSLVAAVMGDLGAPALLVEPGASPHGYSLRPSQARALGQADVLFMVSDALTPWLVEAAGSLAPGTARHRLAEVEGTRLLPTREGADFESDHEHDHDHHDHDHDHDHGGTDPHAWLDPGNADLWLDAIAAELGRLDPDNAGQYSANAATARKELDSLAAGITDRLAPLHHLRFVVFHDAFQYFETRFGLQASGAIALSDATLPGPAALARLRDRIRDFGAACVFSEPQQNPALIDSISGADGLRVVELDPLGARIEPGAGLYPTLLRNMGAAFQDCAAGDAAAGPH
ncbi:zinc ABC transporter substrate-binding protein [Pontibaca methylaminivorans]|uniref:zinc ABC transporter substrate-binding protein n=1 Tax=Pontibaca methylaminivorans TaxID=515897 RepID=UPI002FD9294F